MPVIVVMPYPMDRVTWVAGATRVQNRDQTAAAPGEVAAAGKAMAATKMAPTEVAAAESTPSETPGVTRVGGETGRCDRTRSHETQDDFA
jgi:hypothetical protein